MSQPIAILLCPEDKSTIMQMFCFPLAEGLGLGEAGAGIAQLVGARLLE